MSTPPRDQTFFISTFGCPKNLVDSEHIAGLLSAHGWRRTLRPTAARLLVVNTCGFIADAQKESLQALLSACALKHLGAVRHVVAAGCLVQLEGQSVVDQLPGLDLAVGVNDWQDIPRLINGDLDSRNRLYRTSPAPMPCSLPRRELSGSHVRYVKIAEGCDCGCGFCVIPRIRGRQRSVPADMVVRDTRRLIQRGAKEIVLVAQDTTAYGNDIGSVDGLPELIRTAAGVVGDGGGERWLRVLYLNPARISPALLRAMASRPALPYFDLALQHASPRVLSAMRRAVPMRGWEPLIDTIRDTIPEAVIRATILIGHPGETAADFNCLLKFLAWADIDRVGVFTFSPQPGTPSAAMDAPGPEETASRLEELEALLAEQAALRASSLIGRQLLVLVDALSRPDPVATVRPWTDAPDIDWHYHLPVNARPGTFAEAVVVGGTAGTIELEPVPST